MKIEVLYPIPMDAGAEFVANNNAFANSYAETANDVPNELILCFCNGKPDVAPAENCIYYQGGGWDIGCYQFAAECSDADLMIFMNARTYFWRDGWLKRFVQAFERWGDKGLYGASGSFERSPHIRTATFATNPRMLRRFPYKVTNREEGFMFESGEWNFTHWYLEHGWPVKVVNWETEVNIEDCRKTPNTFRRGDQSEMLVRDKHTDIYARATVEERMTLQRLADGKA